MDKDALRREFSATRVTMTRAEVVAKSADIAKSVQGLVDWSNVGRAHVYWAHSKFNEVETAWLETFLWTTWPHVELTIGDSSKSALMPVGQYDLVLVPMLAFDESRHRLGFGGGWYDKFLATQPHAMTVGLAFDVQYSQQLLRVEPHDIRLDYIVTETRTFRA